MRFRSLHKLWPSALGAALVISGLTACGGSGSADLVQAADSQGNAQINGIAPLIRDMANAPWTVAYHGVRRLDFPTEDPSLAYREAVAADGEGRYAIDVLEVLTPHPNPQDFIRLQAQNKGFNYRYRGFRILEPNFFQSNYSVSLLANSQLVAGVNCTRVLVKKTVVSNGQPSRHHLVDVDPQTGMVLAWQELDSQGNHISGMKFESFSYGLPSPPVEMTAGSHSETELGIGRMASGAGAFKVLRPTWLPESFRLTRGFEVTDGSGKQWIRQIFTDGQVALIFMHQDRMALPAGQGDYASTLGVYEEGEWTVVMGEVQGYPLMAVGKMDGQSMQDFVGSCF